jgi:hypothetical protein
VAEFDRLRSLIAQVNPLHLLSLLAMYGLTSVVTERDEVLKPEESKTVQQCHIELLQALFLSMPIEQIGKKWATRQQVQAIWDLVMEVSHLFASQRYRQANTAKTQEERAIIMFQETIGVQKGSRRITSIFC